MGDDGEERGCRVVLWKGSGASLATAARLVPSPISSVGGLRGVFGGSVYNASKFAVGGFTQALAEEMAHFGVHVTGRRPRLLPHRLPRPEPTSLGG